MTYATPQDLEELYGEEYLIVASSDDDATVIDTARVARVSEASHAKVNSFVGKQHSLPLLEPVDPVLKGLEGDITLYNLPNNGLERTEFSRTRYEDALAHLKLIAKGDAELQITEPVNTDPAKPSGATITSNERLFTRKGMGDIL